MNLGEAQSQARQALALERVTVAAQWARAFTPGQVRAVAFLHDHAARWVPYWFAARLVSDTGLLVEERGTTAARRFLSRMGLPLAEAYTVIYFLSSDPARRPL